jgi:hypothetical protein
VVQEVKRFMFLLQRMGQYSYDAVVLFRVVQISSRMCSGDSTQSRD